MDLLAKIKDNLAVAQKSKNEKEISALRMLIAAIKNEEIAKRPKVLEKEDVLTVVKREIKKLKDGIFDFRAGGREDLASAYEEEMKILSKYLPEEISEEKLRKIVAEKVSSASDKNFGAIMKAVMAEVKGQADGAIISRLVKELLG